MVRSLSIVLILLSIIPVYALYHIDGAVNIINANSITLVNEYAFLGSNSQLRVVDISDPGNPLLLSTNLTIDALYQGRSVIRDTLAYIYDYQRIKVVNIANPQEPFLEGVIDSLGTISNFTVAAPYVYICTPDTLLQVIDITDISNPQVLGSCQVSRLSGSIRIAGNLVFITGGYDGPGNSIVQIIDVSDPANPIVCYTYHPSYLAKGVAVNGNIAYVAARYSGMLMWDITDPYQPVNLGVFNPARGVSDIFIQGDTACLANELKGILMVDISSPANPQIIGSCDTPGFAYYVASRDNLVYAISSERLLVIDVTDPLPASCIVGSYNISNNDFTSLALGNSRLYCIDEITGLRILDVSNPTLPVPLSEYPDLGAKEVQVYNNKAYIVNAFGSYDIVDVTNPLLPQALGSYTGLGFPETALVSGNYAYVLDADEGLVILNITNPANPTLQGAYPDLVNPYALAIRGIYVYILDRIASFPKIKVINVTNHSAPQYAGETSIPHDPNSIAVYGSYAYVVSSEGGLQVYQINNNTSLTLQNSYLPHPTSDLIYCTTYGTRLYVTDNAWNEIDIYDLANPAQPALITSYKWNYGSVDLKINGNLLYTANEYSGIHILDLNSMVGNIPDLPVPTMLSLSNYPNPFLQQTTISYTLTEKGQVELNIYNVRGQLVRHLEDEYSKEGTHTVNWDGKTDHNEVAAAGVYIYRLSTPDKQMTGRMLRLK